MADFALKLRQLPKRLVKVVKDSTTLSVVEIREAYRQGRIALSQSGRATAGAGLDTLVFAEDQVLLDGELLCQNKQHFTAVLNKPKATISTAKDPRGKGDLSPWLNAMPPGTFPVGRLDRDTTGLLLFTTDGTLANAVLRPDHHTPKLYWLWLNEQFEHGDARLDALTRQDDPRYDGASAAEILNLTPHYVELHLRLHQGKHRQIRRMCRALNLRLLHLHRKSIGPITDTGLKTGQFRQLRPQELAGLWEATGGVQRMWLSKREALERQAQALREQCTPNARLEAWLCANAP